MMREQWTKVNTERTLVLTQKLQNLLWASWKQS